MHSNLSSVRGLLAALLLGVLAAALSAPGAERAVAAGVESPPYPRVNLAPWYEVDPAWPQRPPDIAWGQMPSLTVDQQDQVWLYTRTNPTVQVYSPEGRYLRGWRREQKNASAHAIRFDAEGNVWLVDVGLHTVTKHTREGQPILTLGTENQPGEDGRHFNKPTDVAFGPKGDIYVSDGYGNSRVARFDRQGRFLKAWGRLGVDPGQLSIAHGIVCDSKGRVYVADRNNVRIQVFDPNGKLLDVWRDLLVPWGLWVSPQDEIWACGSSPMPWSADPKNAALPLGCPPKDQVFMRFNSAGKLLQLWTVPKAVDGQEKPGELNWLHTLALDSKGNIYCGDIMGKRVQKLVRKNP